MTKPSRRKAAAYGAILSASVVTRRVPANPVLTALVAHRQFSEFRLECEPVRARVRQPLGSDAHHAQRREFEEWRFEGALLQKYFLRGFPFRAVARDFAGDALDQHARDLERLAFALLARVQVHGHVRMLEQVLKLLGCVV